jgi:hypothetical protein
MRLWALSALFMGSALLPLTPFLTLSSPSNGFGGGRRAAVVNRVLARHQTFS